MTVYEAAWRASVLLFMASMAAGGLCVLVAFLVFFFAGEAVWKAGVGYAFFALVLISVVGSYVVTARKLASKAKCHACGGSNAVLRWGRASWKGHAHSRPSPECRKCGADLKSMVV